MPGLEHSELGGCRLIRKIGAGAMGEVYLAEQVHLGNRLVAVKVVQVLHDPALPDDSLEGAEWHFIREAQLLGRLTHPNILPVYHSGVEAGYLFLVMQYAPDGSLADAINGRGPHRLDLPASVPFVIDTISQVASALQYTHEHGVVHADVKPGNVLAQVERDGHWRVLLADFGIAHSRDTVASRNEIAGTVAYMAPEQFYGQMSPASDQYALAVMAYQLLTGRTPFAGGFLEVAQAHARENPPALRALNPSIPATVETVIARALAKRPADRFPSVLAFAEALRMAFVGASTLFDANTRAAAAALPVPAGARSRGPVPPASQAATRRKHVPKTQPPTELVARHDATTVPDAPPLASAPPASRGTHRTAAGLAVVALLLVAVVAAIGLRSHIGVSQASSSSMTGVGAATGQTPGSHSSGGGTGGNGSSSPTTVVPTPQSPTPQTTPSPETTQTPAPTATSTVTTTPVPIPTATAKPQPTATVGPKLTPTPASGPKATVAPTPVPPLATTSSPPTASAGSTTPQQPATAGAVPSTGASLPAAQNAG